MPNKISKRMAMKTKQGKTIFFLLWLLLAKVGALSLGSLTFTKLHLKGHTLCLPSKSTDRHL